MKKIIALFGVIIILVLTSFCVIENKPVLGAVEIENTAAQDCPPFCFPENKNIKCG
ncbi:MAG: hypothetical protein U9Q34_01075 [Elusimicrobiota bacterium]|nr:hypothetical protein [Elusimicrobiota bacterium]